MFKSSSKDLSNKFSLLKNIDLSLTLSKCVLAGKFHINTPCPSVPVRCISVASPINGFLEIATPVPN